jgi:hypothetical protein
MSVRSTGLSDDERHDTLKSDPLAGYYTEAEVARLLRKSPRTIARMRARRELPFTVIGKTPYVSPNHVQQMLRGNEIGRRRG